MKDFEKISNKLNELLVKNYDAEKGYIHAMQNVDNDRLQAFFKERSEERSEFAKDLRTHILRYGGDPDDTGSFKGTMHRNWMTLKSLFSSNDEEAILEEVLKGEKASLDDYNELLSNSNLPVAIETLLTSQKNAINNIINTAKRYEAVLS